MRCGENPVHERMNSIAENKGDCQPNVKKNNEFRLIPYPISYLNSHIPNREIYM